MQIKEKTLLDRLKEGYEVTKKPLAYFIIFIIVVMEVTPSSILPEEVRDASYPIILVSLGLIILETLFTIYEKIVKSEKKLNIIGSNKLYDHISDIVMNEKAVDIKYIGIAGRHGWPTVLEKLLDENNPDSLISNRTKFNIDIALMSPAMCENDGGLFSRFESVSTICKTILRISDHILQIAQPGSSIKLYHYQYMPNMLGFLVGGNYLFVTHTYWEKSRGVMTLRAGGTDYFIYDKNDDFGGQEMIRRFSGWFDYIETKETRVDPRSLVESAPDSKAAAQ